MSKRILIILGTLVLAAWATAQEDLIKTIEPVRSYDGMVEFQKTPQAARIFEFSYPAKDLDKAIGNYLEQRGGKVRGVKGFSVAKGVILERSENKIYDVYFRVDGKGSGDKAVSSLTVILAEPDENILLRTPPQAGEAGVTAALPIFSGAGAAAFFDGLGTVVGDYEHGKVVAACEEDLRKAEKRYNDLVDEGQSLAKKKQKLEQDIADNFDAQGKQAREIEKAKVRLDQVKAMKRG